MLQLYFSRHDAGFERADLEDVLAYLDDIIVFSHSFEDHLESLKKVCEHFRAFHFETKTKKVLLFPN